MGLRKKRAAPESPPEPQYWVARHDVKWKPPGLAARLRTAYAGTVIRIVGDYPMPDGFAGPFTGSEAEEYLLRWLQRQWDETVEARRKAWDAAYDRARRILAGAVTYGGVVGSAAAGLNDAPVRELQLLIFQVEYGSNNTGPEMATQRPTTYTLEDDKWL